MNACFCIFTQKNLMLAPLQPNDLIVLVSPAKAIDETLVLAAKSKLEGAGFRVELGQYVVGQKHYFSGTDEERAADFQWAIDHPEAKAILCARGGYGCIRILDRIQWASQLREPKWLVGFSDVTVFHQYLQKFELPSIHATMPLNFGEITEEAWQSLIDALLGKTLSYTISANKNNQLGEAKGKLLGGNLSILYSLLGTDLQPDYTNSILFIEDLAEQLYHIDRMFYAFQHAGILNQIKGLIVGGMTDLKDTATPIGFSLEELILQHFQYRSIPIAFDFPAGHIPDNRSLILGKEVSFNVHETSVTLTF